jgi:hypothetical protein
MNSTSRSFVVSEFKIMTEARVCFSFADTDSRRRRLCRVVRGRYIDGAFVASAFSLALVVLRAGIGLVSVSPWSSNNPSVTTFGAVAAAWFVAVQQFASGVGGCLAGRLSFISLRL